MTEAQAKRMWEAAWTQGYDEGINQIRNEYTKVVEDFNNLLENYNNLLALSDNKNLQNKIQEEKVFLQSVVEIKNDTFTRYGVKLTSYGISSISNDGWFDFNFDLEGNLLEDTCFYVKINCYDENNNLIKTDKELITPDDFAGFDSCIIHLQEDALAFQTKKIIVFFTK